MFWVRYAVVWPWEFWKVFAQFRTFLGTVRCLLSSWILPSQTWHLSYYNDKVDSYNMASSFISYKISRCAVDFNMLTLVCVLCGESKRCSGLTTTQAQIMAELFGGRLALLSPPRPCTLGALQVKLSKATLTNILFILFIDSYKSPIGLLLANVSRSKHSKLGLGIQRLARPVQVSHHVLYGSLLTDNTRHSCPSLTLLRGPKVASLFASYISFETQSSRQRLCRNAIVSWPQIFNVFSPEVIRELIHLRDLLFVHGTLVG